VSDYFTRLAERAIGTTPLPRPALPSPFEPASLAGFEEIELEVPASGVSTRQAETGPPPRVGQALVIDLNQPRSDQTANTPARQVVEPAHSAPDSVPLSRQRAVDATTPAAAGQVLVHEHHREIIERQSIVVAPLPAATPPGEPATPAPQPRRIEARPLTQATVAASLPTSRDPAHDAPAPTVVQVTIGRVDVRAVTPPTPSRERSRPQRPPRPSLEDYLSGGRP
jgi:hypothetical protein